MINFRFWKTSFNPCTVSFLNGLVGGLLGAIIFAGVLHFFAPASPIASVNLREILQRFIHSQTNAHLTEAELQRRTQWFGKNLDTVLHEVAEQYHVILMPEQAVIAGSQDLTEVVLKKLNQREAKLKSA